MPGETEDRVVALVVSFNRRALLLESIRALRAQSRSVDAILVVDNASEDGSAEAVSAEDPDVEIVRLPRNTGGAGGFAVGIAVAVERMRADLVWLMDDDTVPEAGALAALLRARSRYPRRADVLASRVVWTDGIDHPMNVPRARALSPWRGSLARAADAISVRSASFVSLAIDARAVRKHGLPLAAYFLWNDDFEFSTRLIRTVDGLYVPGSRVVHKTAARVGTDGDPGHRFYYEVRNKLWMLRHSNGLRPWEKAMYGAATLRRWARTLRRSTDRPLLLSGLRRGFVDARTPPPSTTEVLSDLLESIPEIRSFEKRTE